MLVFWKERLVFLAVPKTGSTAYARALGPRAGMVVSDPPELKHAPVYRYNRFFRPMFEKLMEADMELMAVIREPLSWLGSWYRYRQRPFMAGHPNSTHEVSFEEFVLGYMQGQRPGFANVGNQLKFIEPTQNGTRVSHLFRYENPARLVGFLEERLETTLDLPRANVSPKMDLGLSRDVERRFRKKFAADYALWEGIA